MQKKIGVLCICVIVALSPRLLSAGGQGESKKLPREPSKEVIERLDRSFEKGESGISEIIAILDEGIENSRSPEGIEKIGHSVDYLHRYILQGVRRTEIGYALCRAMDSQWYLPNTLDTASALKDLTGIDVGYNKDFIDRYDGSDEDIEERESKLRIWRLELGCPSFY